MRCRSLLAFPVSIDLTSITDSMLIIWLEQFLIKTYGFSEHDAKVKVMQDFDEVKEDFEMKENEEI